MAQAQDKSQRQQLFDELHDAIGNWVLKDQKHKDDLLIQVAALTEACGVYENALAHAVKKAKQRPSLRNKDKKPPGNWRWVFLCEWQIAAMDPANVHEPLVTVLETTPAMGFWAENLPFDPLGRMMYYYGPEVSYGTRAEPRNPDSLPPGPASAEETLMCKSALIAVMCDEPTHRESADRLTPDGFLDWPASLWDAINICDPTPLTDKDFNLKTARISDTWKDVQAAFAEKRQTPPADEIPRSCSHSKDFTTVTWYGSPYYFNPTQAKCVSLLWAEWCTNPTGKNALHQRTIRDGIESDNSDFRLSQVFRNDPAWDRMIYALGTGRFYLAEPKKRAKKPTHKTSGRKLRIPE